jgi:hypothetical protein
MTVEESVRAMLKSFGIDGCDGFVVYRDPLDPESFERLAETQLASIRDLIVRLGSGSESGHVALVRDQVTLKVVLMFYAQAKALQAGRRKW